jgi:hypothetical protein
MGRPVEMLCAFLPLPPGIPSSLIVTSYDGQIILSVDADESIAPDADRFLDFMIKEYCGMRKEAAMKISLS